MVGSWGPSVGVGYESIGILHEDVFGGIGEATDGGGGCIRVQVEPPLSAGPHLVNLPKGRHALTDGALQTSTIVDGPGSDHGCGCEKVTSGGTTSSEDKVSTIDKRTARGMETRSPCDGAHSRWSVRAKERERMRQRDTTEGAVEQEPGWCS